MIEIPNKDTEKDREKYEALLGRFGNAGMELITNIIHTLNALEEEVHARGQSEVESGREGLPRSKSGK